MSQGKVLIGVKLRLEALGMVGAGPSAAPPRGPRGRCASPLQRPGAEGEVLWSEVPGMSALRQQHTGTTGDASLCLSWHARDALLLRTALRHRRTARPRHALPPPPA